MPEPIIRKIVVGIFMTNSYIVGCPITGKAMVIDPGDSGEEIVDEANSLKLKPTLIVATHTHMDHIGDVERVRKLTGAKFAVHESAKEKPPVEGWFFGFKFPEPDIALRDGDVIKIGELSFQVLHTPGHSRCGISLYGHGVVFTGDALFNMSIGRTDLPGASSRELIKSIKEKLMTLPEDTIVLPGHGPETKIGYEKKHNPFL